MLLVNESKQAIYFTYINMSQHLWTVVCNYGYHACKLPPNLVKLTDYLKHF